MSIGIASYDKDPNAALDYGLSWSRWLGDDTLVDSEWSIAVAPAGDSESETPLAIDSQSFDDTNTLVWLSGGVVGRYVLTNHITSSSTPPRIDDRSIVVWVKER